ncbi:MAG: hypothetical protein IJP99_10630 [Methanobrevibacter sp.]|nr:hypothetical protein [Methanobrevibacter sp.]MBR0059773.1 hypothetical protein [Methanobrevibacter sp.]
MVIVSNPQRPLDRGVEMSKFELFCRKIAPYVLFVCIIVLLALVFVVLAKYGANITGTEANQFYNHLGEL